MGKAKRKQKKESRSKNKNNEPLPDFAQPDPAVVEYIKNVMEAKISEGQELFRLNILGKTS